ncbi:putative glycoside hydrolase [bacterium]|nr:putative glycoside hydrolase [bacterium]
MKKRFKSKNKINRTGLIISGLLAAGFFSVLYFGIPTIIPTTYNGLGLASDFKSQNNIATSSSNVGENQIRQLAEKKFVATHVKTPKAVKAIYMTSWVAGTPSFREKLVKIADETEINSIIIDIKDYTGRIAFKVDDESLQEVGSVENRISDIREFIARLHEKGIYVMGRISVFQDPYYVSKYPEFAVRRESDDGIWEDYKGISWLDAGSKEVWDYTVAIAKESYNTGFDELNFDYIRFPSDGNMYDIKYPFSEEKVMADPNYGKAEVMRSFFKYLHEEMKDTDAVLSADMFGMVTTNPDDLNIGQVLEYAEPYFDYIAPMTYPSHYPKGFNGYPNPNKEVYGVIKYSMDQAVRRMNEASTTPLKIRPWLQDFDYGGNYDIAEVRAQIQAVYDSGLTSWMLWDPSNRYTVDALLKE